MVFIPGKNPKRCCAVSFRTLGLGVFTKPTKQITTRADCPVSRKRVGMRSTYPHRQPPARALVLLRFSWMPQAVVK